MSVVVVTEYVSMDVSTYIKQLKFHAFFNLGFADMFHVQQVLNQARSCGSRDGVDSGGLCRKVFGRSGKRPETFGRSQ